MKIETYADAGALADGVADLLAARLGALISGAGRARLAVPGGRTPRAMLERLGGMALEWDRVGVTLTDERWVPVSDTRSNQRMLAETLFRGAAAGAEFVPLYGATPEPGESLGAVAMALKQIVLPLDIAVLGMGADMHTASIFPGALGLDAALEGAEPVVAIKAPGIEETRVTLSLPVLAGAERHVLVQGADKRRALETARAIGDPRRAPIAALLDGATVHYAD